MDHPSCRTSRAWGRLPLQIQDIDQPDHYDGSDQCLVEGVRRTLLHLSS